MIKWESGKVAVSALLATWFFLTCWSSADASGSLYSELPRRCIAFSPYVGSYSPAVGPHPAPAQIDALLDRLIATSDFRCILSYGVLNGLDYVFQSAAARGIKVVAILWLDGDPAVNQASIAKGIDSAKAFTNTIVGLSCGSEYRTRHPNASEAVIVDCIDQLRAAGVKQPITSIDTWWEWCNRAYPCQRWSLVDKVDWVGINVFPWWENKFSGYFSCTRVDQAAAFHIARLQDVRARYPGKEVVLTEFGWPAGPDNFREPNRFTSQECLGAEAGERHQRRIVTETLAKLDALGLRGIVFESFRQGNWKVALEGQVGPKWGICSGTVPYDCKQLRTIAANFDGDRKSDIGIYREGWWSILASAGDSPLSVHLGGPTWTPVPADYDGDGTTDMAVYLAGTWVILRSTDGQTVVLAMGGPAFVPVPGDYDGDGLADVAVYLDGVWSIRRSSDGVNVTIAHGGPEWEAVPSDYDGDGRTDIAVHQEGAWSILQSTKNQIAVFGHGGPQWRPVAADYDGDGRADVAVYHPSGAWSVVQSTSGTIVTDGHGGANSQPVPADYDGDTKADIAVYLNGAWVIKQSSDGSIRGIGHGGGPQDIPLN